MVDGQVWQVIKVRHHFDQDRDDQHPACPLHAYQDVEIRDVWNLPPERQAPRQKKVAKRLMGRTITTRGRAPNKTSGQRGSAAPAPEYQAPRED